MKFTFFELTLWHSSLISYTSYLDRSRVEVERCMTHAKNNLVLLPEALKSSTTLSLSLPLSEEKVFRGAHCNTKCFRRKGNEVSTTELNLRLKQATVSRERMYVHIISHWTFSCTLSYCPCSQCRKVHSKWKWTIIEDIEEETSNFNFHTWTWIEHTSTHSHTDMPVNLRGVHKSIRVSIYMCRKWIWFKLNAVPV